MSLPGRIWMPLVAILGAAILGLGLMVALGVNGDTTITKIVKQCIPSEPGCETRPATHEHADFALWIRGKKFDFNQPQFISTETKELSDDVHIHAPRTTVVHVHRARTTWDEFFTSLGFQLNDSTLSATRGKASLKLPTGEVLTEGNGEKFTFYVNGVKVDGVARMNITDLDRVLISFGNQTDAQIADELAQVTDQACIPSEKCLDRIPAGEPKEQCTLSSNSCQ